MTDSSGFRIISGDRQPASSRLRRLASLVGRRVPPIARHGAGDASDVSNDACAAAERSWPLAVLLALSALAGTAAAVALAAWLFVQIASMTAAAASAAGSVIGEWGVVQVITNPVRHYFATHTGALPVSPGLLSNAWAAAGLGLLALSWTGSFGARIGWTLIGAATTAMVHAATPVGAAWLATGITALTWAVLSIPAFAGAGRPAPMIVDRSAPPPCD